MEVVCSYSWTAVHDEWKIAPFLFVCLFFCVYVCVCVSVLLNQGTVIRQVALSLAAQQC